MVQNIQWLAPIIAFLAKLFLQNPILFLRRTTSMQSRLAHSLYLDPIMVHSKTNDFCDRQIPQSTIKERVEKEKDN